MFNLAGDIELTAGESPIIPSRRARTRLAVDTRKPHPLVTLARRIILRLFRAPAMLEEAGLANKSVAILAIAGSQMTLRVDAPPQACT